jgi:hypothetical protein
MKFPSKIPLTLILLYIGTCDINEIDQSNKALFLILAYRVSIETKNSIKSYTEISIKKRKGIDSKQ